MACSRVNFTFNFISDGSTIFMCFYNSVSDGKMIARTVERGAQRKHYPKIRLDAKPKSRQLVFEPRLKGGTFRMPPLHHPHRCKSISINTGFRILLQSLMTHLKNISRRPRLSHHSALLATHHTDTQRSTQYSSAPHTNISKLLTQHSLVTIISRFTNFPYTRCTNTGFSNLQSNFLV